MSTSAFQTRAAPGPVGDRIGSRSAGVASAVATGLLLATAFPPFAWPIVSWIALVPLLRCLPSLSFGRALRAGLIAGVTFFLAGMAWLAPLARNFLGVSSAASVGIFLSGVLLQASHLGLFSGTLRLVHRRGIPLGIAAPLVWVACEWLRANGPFGFPWLLLGYTQHDHTVIAQTAELGSVYAVSALLVFVSAMFVEVAFGDIRGRRLRAASLMVVTMLAVLCWGYLRLSEVADAPVRGTIRVALVQGNIGLERVWNMLEKDAVLGTYEDLTGQAVSDGATLAVWPESAIPHNLEVDTAARTRLAATAKRLGMHLLFGAEGYRDRNGLAAPLNRAYLVASDGTLVGWYDKRQLVPFGEQVPGRTLLGGPSMDYLPGDREGLLALPEATLGILICHEAGFPTLAQSLADGGADILVNLTNDGWSGSTAALEQTLAVAQFRAIENRLPMVRVAKTGISAVIDGDGTVRWQSPPFARLVHTELLRLRSAPAYCRMLRRYFAPACALTSAALVLAAWSRTPRRI